MWKHASYTYTFFVEWGDETGKCDHPRVNEQFAHLPNASQVFRAVLHAEPEIGIQTMTDIVPIKYISPEAIIVEHFLHRMGQSGFPRSGKSGKPEHNRAVSV